TPSATSIRAPRGQRRSSVIASEASMTCTTGWQAALQKASPPGAPLSQRSGATTTPSPQIGAQTLGADPSQAKWGSTSQVEEQPSPSSVLPSSQASSHAT